MILFRKVNVRLIYLLVPYLLLLLFITLTIWGSNLDTYIQRSKVLVDFSFFVSEYKNRENRWPLPEDYENYLRKGESDLALGFFMLHRTVVEASDISEDSIKYTFYFERIPTRVSVVTVELNDTGIPIVEVNY